MKEHGATGRLDPATFATLAATELSATLGAETASTMAEFADTVLGTAPGAPRAAGETRLPELRVARRAGAAAIRTRQGSNQEAHEAPSGADFEVIQVIGAGGMGVVELARQPALGREVALKTLRRESEDLRALLLREARIAGSLEHPNVVPIHALGLDEKGSPVLVMKRIEGRVWQEVLAERPEDWAGEWLVLQLRVLEGVCRAIELAHSRGVIHRDVKPDNVMIGEFGEVYLVDWGIAVTREEAESSAFERTGTPAYVAPEMVDPRRGKLGERSDVYLLGATLHEILTGKPKNHGRTAGEALRAALEGAPYAYPEEVPLELAAIAARATARDPEDRYAGAREVREAIAGWLAHRAVLALVRASEEKLEELERLVGAPDAAKHEDRAEELFFECRFGLEQAKREPVGTERIGRGLDRAHAAMIAIAILRRDHHAAARLLAAMASPTDELRGRIDALGRELADENRRARDADVRIGGRDRAIVAFRQSAVIFVVGAGAHAAIHWGGVELTYARMYATTVPFPLIGLVAYLRARELRETQVGAAIAKNFLIVAPTSFAVGVGLSHLLGVPVELATAIPFFGASLMALSLGFVASPVYVALSPMMLLAGATVVLLPKTFPLLQLSLVAAGGVAGGMYWLRSGRARPPPDRAV